jgi:hypothetical protein
MAKLIGKAEYKKHLVGERLTMKQAIQAQCYSCMHYYTDGIEDCQSKLCPLYGYMPYRGKN